MIFNLLQNKLLLYTLAYICRGKGLDIELM